MASAHPSPDAGAPPAPELGHVVLVGMMGAGKSTAARALAGRLGRRVLDSDAEIERRTGTTVEALWAAGEVERFRALESQVLREALDSPVPAVVAAAGGVVLDPANRRLLRRHRPVVWLRARLDTLARRVGDGSGRPLLAADPPGALALLYAERRPLYAEVADVVVDVDDMGVEAVADLVVDALARA